jgi:RNA polymerase sigma factor (sigma-70 family)
VDFVSEWRAVEAQLRRFCIRALRDPDLADDVLQNTRVRAWRAYGSFQRRALFATWVTAIARREIARATARSGRFVPLDSIPEPQAPQAAAPEDASLGQALLEAIADAIDRGELTDAEAAVVKARLADPDAAWGAVGERLSITANSCAVLHFRAMGKLRLFLFRFHPRCLGGPAEISRAFEAARRAAAPSRRLTEAEVRAFQACVLHPLPRVPRGLLEDVRAACVKVALQVQRP